MQVPRLVVDTINDQQIRSRERQGPVLIYPLDLDRRQAQRISSLTIDSKPHLSEAYPLPLRDPEMTSDGQEGRRRYGYALCIRV